MKKIGYISIVLGVVLLVTFFGVSDLRTRTTKVLAGQPGAPSSKEVWDGAMILSSSGISQTAVFLPLVTVNHWSAIELAGLSIVRPSNWQVPAVTTPITNTGEIAGRDAIRFVSPDGMYHIDVFVDWFTTPSPELPFGLFEKEPNAHYEESVQQLSTGELVQVMRLTSANSEAFALLAHAAFRAEHGSYSLGLYGEVIDEQLWGLFSETLASMKPNLSTLPAPIEGATQKADFLNAASATIIPAAIQSVSYDRDAAVQYTSVYWNLFTNSDSCYLFYNDATLRCGYLEGYWGVDGAHFVNRALHAGGISIPGLWNGVALRTGELRTWVLSNGGQEVSNVQDLHKGDMVYYGRNGTCWGWVGMAIDEQSSRPRVRLHSQVTLGGITYAGMEIYYDQVKRDSCGDTNRHSYVHMNTVQDEPGPLLSQSLTRIPSTPFAGQEVEATFQICNFGAQPFDVDQLYVQTTAPGVDFPSVDPPSLAPGGNGCYDYSQTATAFPSEGWYTIRAGYVQNGTFKVLGTVAGVVNTQQVYVVSPDVIQIQGEMSVMPEFLQQGDTATVEFTVKNTGSSSVTDRFRVVIYEEDLSTIVVSFPESSDVTLGPGETWTYNADQVMDTPGIYWAVGEHYIGGTWLPVYGESQKLIRVMYPMPSKPALAKGIPPYINLLGEPVNPRTGNFVHEHTDRVYPLPGISFDVTRFFNSLDADEVVGQFGNGFTWSWGWRIEWRADKTAVLTYPDGRVTYFMGELDIDDPFNLSGEYVGEFAETQTLTLAEDGTTALEGNDQLRYEFDAEGRLARVRDGSDNGLDILWNGAGHIEKVTHTSGAEFPFEYTGDYVTAITFPDGEELTYTYSGDGDLLTAANPAGEALTYTYDDNNRMLTIENAKGERILLNKYDDEGRVEEQTNVNGVLSTFDYAEEDTTVYYNEDGIPVWHTFDSEFRLIRVEDARGAVTTYAYDDDFNRIEKVDAEGGVWRWAFDDHARVISSTNPVDATWLYTYDERGNLTEERDPLGNITERVYDEHNNLLREIDSEGSETVREYNDQGLVIRKTDPTGAVTTYTYNAMGLVTSITDAMGTSTMAYDESGNRIRFTDAAGRTMTSTFDAEGRMLTTTGPQGNTIAFTHDDNGNLLFETDGAGHTRFFIYEDADRLISRTDWAGNVWLLEYDTLGRLIREENPLHGVILYTHDEVGNVITKRDLRGGIWRYAYDLNNRLITETDPLGNEIHYTYDDAGQRTALDRSCPTCDGGRAVEYFEYDLAGQLTAYTDGRGYTTEYRYDRAGRKIEEIDALGNSTRYGYNARGDLIEIIDAHGNSTTREYNAVGWLITETNRLGFTAVRTYDNVGNLLSVKDERGNVTRYTYDVADRLIRIQNALGGVTRFEYDTRGNLVKTLDALGRKTTSTYDANNNVLSITNPRDYTTYFEYDVLGRRVKMIDALGGETLYTYDAAGDLLTDTDPAGYTRSTTYDLLGRPITETDRNGNATRFEYDAAGDLVRVIDALEGETTFTYDANHSKLTETNALGHTTTYEYDPLNRQVKVIDALDGISTRAYDALGRIIEEVDANGHTSRYTYDAEGRRVAWTDALDHTTSYEFDPVGNLLRVTGRNGYVTRYVYDALNRQVMVVNALGHNAIMLYDAVGNPIKKINFRGYATRFEYDANDNLARVIDALGGETTHTYDALDRKTATTDANGHITAFELDAVSNVVSITLPEGQTSTYTFDGERNQLTFTNAKGYTYTKTYDALNRPVSEIDPMGHVRRTEYDAIGQAVREVDANGNDNRYTYDPLGRLVGVTDALGKVTTYVYDPVGNLLSETDANGHTTTYTYDPLNRLIEEVNPIDSTWTYTYDPEGNMIRKVDANGQIITYVFDAIDQMIAIHYPDSDQDVTYVYDPNGNLVEMTDSIGVTVMDYDPLDREVSKTDPYGRTTLKTYDAVSNQLSVTYPSSGTVTYAYNANDWLVTMTDPNSGETLYTYDPDGLVIRLQFPNNTWTNKSYDKAGRLIEQFNGTMHNAGLVTAYTFVLDAEGNRLETLERYTSGQIRSILKTYEYSARYEVLQAVEEYEGPPSSVVTTTYAYDPAGNRVAMMTNRDIGPGPQPELELTVYTYDAANHLLSANAVTYTYDPNGNRLTKRTPGPPPSQTRLETYAYDYENRMVQYTRVRVQSGQIEQRVYNEFDGLGRRLNKGLQDASGVTKWTEYVLDGWGYDQLVEYPQTGTPRVTQIYRGLGGQIVSMEEIQGDGQGTHYWMPTDGLGSVAASTKHDGQSAHEYFYDAYGQLIDDNGHWEDSSSWTNPHNHYLLTGKEWDEESRLYYFGARFYDAEAGVWLTQDPYRGGINSPMTRHRTLYVRNNPINRIDPLGFFDFSTGAVQWGDTWESIAAQWGTSVATLKRLNPWIAVPRVGDYLQLPECRSAECQLQLGITEVRIGGVSGTACGQRIVQRQKAWLAEVQARQEWQQKINNLGLESPSGMNSSQLQQYYNEKLAEIEAAKSSVKQPLYMSTGCGVDMCCALPTNPFTTYEVNNTQFSVGSSNQSSAWSSLGQTGLDYLSEPNGLMLDYGSLVAEKSWQAYWTIYPSLAQNGQYIVRTTPNITPYWRTNPGVNAKATSALATLETTGTFIPVKSPAWNSVSTPFALFSVGYDGYSQWQEDSSRTDLDTLQKVGRTSVQVSASSTIMATSIAVGTTIGTAIPVPILGTAVGFVAGAGVGLVGQWAYENYAEDNIFNWLGFD